MDHIKILLIGLKNKKVPINPINEKYNKCFQYTLTAALNPEEIERVPQRIIKIKRFINRYSWGRQNYPSEKDDLKKFVKNNGTIVLNVLYVKKEKYILPMFQNITQIVENKLYF